MYPTKPPTVRVPCAPSADAARISWNAGRMVTVVGGRDDGDAPGGGEVVTVTPPVAGSTYIVWADGRWRATIAMATAATPTDGGMGAAAIPLVMADADTPAAAPPAAPVASRPAASSVFATR